MDNITHGLVGLVAGELIHRALPACKDSSQDQGRRKLILMTSAIAGNFPDLDLVLTPLLPEPLGYLLHHRGHTHTILYALPQALLLWGLILLFWSSARKTIKESSSAKTGFFAALIVGFILHLGLDYLNSYGIHPFHPLDSRWFYGDMVFIVEPVFWFIFGAPMIMLPRKLWPKALFGFLLAATLFIFTRKGFLSWPSFIALIGLGSGLAWVQKKSGDKGVQALTLAMILGATFVLIQALASQKAKSNLAEELRLKRPDLELLDVSMSSFPANPFCRVFASVEKGREHYYVRQGVMGLLSPANNCPFKFLPPTVNNEDGQIVFSAHSKILLKNFKNMAQGNCHFRAWLRFARAPVVLSRQAYDARFARGAAEDNFTFIDLEKLANVQCPKGAPQWDFPRQDLL